jgi:hypothetical protein
VDQSKRQLVDEIVSAHSRGEVSRRKAVQQLALLGFGGATATTLISTPKQASADNGPITSDDAASARMAIGAAAEDSFINAHNSGPNQLIDGSYELDKNWWAGELGSGKELSRDFAFLGSQSFKITGSNIHYPNVTVAGRTGADATYSVVKSQPGRLYRLSFLLRRPSSNTSTGYVRGVLYLTPPVAQDGPLDDAGGSIASQTDIPPDAWIPYSFTFVVPDGGKTYAHSGVFPAITVFSDSPSDIFYFDAVRFEDLTDWPAELVAPPPTGDRVVDTANIQPLVDAAQYNRGTVVLRAGTYAVDLVTKKVERQPRITGQGKQFTMIDGTIKFQGVSSKFSGGWLSGFSFVGSHPGKTALEMNGVCDVHWEQLRVIGDYEVGLLFHNELTGDFTEICNGSMDFYATVNTAVKYLVSSGDSSFHASGLTDNSNIQHIGKGPAIWICPLARPYNAPLSVRVWSSIAGYPVTKAMYPVISHDGDKQSNFYGNLQIEQTAEVQIAAGNPVYFAGTANSYMAPGLRVDYGSLNLVGSAEAASGGFLSIGPITVSNIRAGGLNGSGDLFLVPQDGGGVRLGAGTGPGWYSGAGSPEGVVAARPGSFYSNTTGGTGSSFFVKETGESSTGWVAK